MTDHTCKRIVHRPTLFIIAIAAIALAGAWIASGRFMSGPQTIYVSGKPIVTVKSHAEAQRVLGQLKGANRSVSQNAVRLSPVVTMHRAGAGAKVVSNSAAFDKLSRVVTPVANVFAINADGKLIVALPSRNDAERTLDLLKKYYKDKLTKVDGEASFKERVYVDETSMDISRLQASPEDAVQALTTPSQPPMLHVVQRGDRGEKIAKEYGISQSDLKRLNPQVDIVRLVEGQELTVKPAQLPITVICKARVDKTVEVEPMVSMSRWHRSARKGKRNVRMLVTYENGQPAGEEIISQITTWNRRPVTDADYSSDSKEGSRSRHYRHRRYKRRSSGTTSQKVTSASPVSPTPSTQGVSPQ